MSPVHRDSILQGVLLSLKFMSAITHLQIIPQIKAEHCPFIKLELHEVKTPFINVFQKT